MGISGTRGEELVLASLVSWWGSVHACCMTGFPLSQASLPCRDSLSLKLPSALSCGFQNLHPRAHIYYLVLLEFVFTAVTSRLTVALTPDRGCLRGFGGISDTQRESAGLSGQQQAMLCLLGFLPADVSLKTLTAPGGSHAVLQPFHGLFQTSRAGPCQPASTPHLQHLPCIRSAVTVALCHLCRALNSLVIF